MSQGPYETRFKKKARQIQFDLNRSTPFALGETHRNNTPSRIISEYRDMETNENPGDAVPQIVDKSQTINVDRPSTSAVPYVNVRAQGATGQPTVGNAESRPSAEQSVSSQINEIRRQILELTTSVSKISLVVQHTQQENKRLSEEVMPNRPKSSSSNEHQVEISPRDSSHSSRASSEHVGAGYSRTFHKMRIDKWGLEFDGNTYKLPVEDFVFRVERLQRQYGVTWTEVLDNFHLFVKGVAEKWYWLFIQTNYVTEWTTLKNALLRQYQSTRSSFELMSDMVERKQQPGEGIDAFFFAMTQMRSRLDISMPEREMIKMLKKNLRDDIRSRVYPIAVSNVEELRQECVEAEKIFCRKDTKVGASLPFNRYTRQVNEIFEKPLEEVVPEVFENVAAIERNRVPTQTSRNPLVCWNCRQIGHMFMDCPSPERALFCYRCGKPEVKSPNCSNCKGRNFPRNDVAAGNHRSKEDPRTTRK